MMNERGFHRTSSTTTTFHDDDGSSSSPDDNHDGRSIIEQHGELKHVTFTSPSSSPPKSSSLWRPKRKLLVIHNDDNDNNKQHPTAITSNQKQRWLRFLVVFGICVYFQYQVMKDANRTLDQVIANSSSNTDLTQSHAANADTDNIKAILKLSNDDKDRILQRMSFDKPSMPLWFGMGQGTTGTHSLYDATCRLNVTSVHGNSVCIGIANHSQVTPSMVDGLRAHFYALDAYKKFRTCGNVNTTTFEPIKNCTLDEATVYINQMKQMIREVILSKSVNAIHDTPYTFMTPYVIQTSNLVRKHLPILLTSERDPMKWSSRRAETHAKSIVCRHYFTFDQNYSSYPIYDAFDVNHCLDLALKKQQQTASSDIESPPTMMYNDVFVSYRRLMAEAHGNETRLQQIVEMNRIAISNYQTLLREYLIHPPLQYSINLFERQGGQVSELEIAHDIYQTLTTNNDSSGVGLNDNTTTTTMKELLQEHSIYVLQDKIPNRSHSKMPHKFIKSIVQNSQSMPGYRAPYFVKH